MNEKDCVREVYRVSIRVGHDVILLFPRGTNGPCPVTGKPGTPVQAPDAQFDCFQLATLSIAKIWFRGLGLTRSNMPIEIKVSLRTFSQITILVN